MNDVVEIDLKSLSYGQSHQSAKVDLGDGRTRALRLDEIKQVTLSLQANDTYRGRMEAGGLIIDVFAEYSTP